MFSFKFLSISKKDTRRKIFFPRSSSARRMKRKKRGSNIQDFDPFIKNKYKKKFMKCVRKFIYIDDQTAGDRNSFPWDKKNLQADIICVILFTKKN